LSSNGGVCEKAATRAGIELLFDLLAEEFFESSSFE